jgi:hypothetical protein
MIANNLIEKVINGSPVIDVVNEVTKSGSSINIEDLQKEYYKKGQMFGIVRSNSRQVMSPHEVVSVRRKAADLMGDFMVAANNIVNSSKYKKGDMLFTPRSKIMQLKLKLDKELSKLKPAEKEPESVDLPKKEVGSFLTPEVKKTIKQIKKDGTIVYKKGSVLSGGVGKVSISKIDDLKAKGYIDIVEEPVKKEILMISFTKKGETYFNKIKKFLK